MNTAFAKYNDLGRILYIGEVPTAMLDLQLEPNNQLIVGVADPATDYIVNGEIARRPVQSTSLVDGALMGLPQPCVIYINNKAYECEDDHAELEFTLPGIYSVRVEAFPFIDANFEIEKK